MKRYTMLALSIIMAVASFTAAFYGCNIITGAEVAPPQDASNHPLDTVDLEGELDGSQWKLITLEDSRLVTDSHISLYFRENGTIWGFGGCNYLGGNYVASTNGTLRFNELLITLLLCPEEGIVEQEKAFLKAVGTVVTYSLEGNILNMSDTAGRKILVFEQIPEYAMDPADLIGTQWTLASVNGEPVTTDEPVSIYFESDSSATGEAGAFKQEFSYRASGDNIEWYASRAIWSNEVPSEEERELARYTGMIAQGASYALSPDRLEVFTYKGDTLVYERLPASGPVLTGECTALAVYMNHPYPGEEGVNYIHEPVIITGFISSPEAIVSVNGVEADVAEDGTYAATVQLNEGSNSIQVIATLGEKFDEITYAVMVSEDGAMYPVPGLGSGGLRYQTRVHYDTPIDVRVGERKMIPLTLEVKKDIREPGAFSYDISRTRCTEKGISYAAATTLVTL